MSEKINIDQVAQLARLRLKPEEREKLSKDLEAILAYVDQLRELNTEGVEPTSHAMALENVFRKDAVKPGEVRDRVLEFAPKREGNFFKVPKVIEG
jgi:aspartyl-tRNA(Asn)/glutamyl-tRNA(Gln) amidotransferase subunit C